MKVKAFRGGGIGLKVKAFRAGGIGMKVKAFRDFPVILLQKK